MNRKALSSLALAALACFATAQSPLFRDPNLRIPKSSVSKRQDKGRKAHTNHIYYIGPWQHGSKTDVAFGPSPFQGSIPGYHPADIREAYSIDGGLGSGIIAIVDAFDLPTKLNDFNVFSSTFGLPVETSTDVTNPNNTVFQVVYQNNVQPPTDAGWGGEIALDIEWAHSMAPNAKIMLFEAQDNSLTNLFAMLQQAAGTLGVREVSNSWGSDEFPGEGAMFEPFLQSASAVIFSSSGDVGGVQSYPATSPSVVGVGGTSLNFSSGIVIGETAWNGSGGGPSSFFTRPSYQDPVTSFVGIHRGCPDISAVADPNTGVAVYDTTGEGGWIVVGGTSLACPVTAAIANGRGQFSAGTAAELNRIYSSQYQTKFFRDIVSGTAGSFSANVGWDFITGCGVPIGKYIVEVPVNFAPVNAILYQADDFVGDYTSLATVDGLTCDLLSSAVPAVGQLAAGEIDFTLDRDVSQFDSITINATLTAVPKATIQFFAYNYLTAKFDLIRALPSKGGQLSLSAPVFAKSKYVESGTNAMRVIIRSLVPSRFFPAQYTLSIDESDVLGTYASG